MSMLKIIGLIMWILPLAGCIILTVQDDLTLSEIEEFIGITLPQNATDIHYSTVAALDRIVRLRFDLPKDDLPTLLDSLRITSLSSNFNSLTNSSTYDWWQPGDIKKFQTADTNINFKSVTILIEELEGNMVRIYLAAGD